MSSEAPSWHATGPGRVAPGVHRIPLPLPHDGLRAVNVYVLEDGDRLVLVDAGSDQPASFDALDSGLRGLGASVSDVGLVLATHGHYDHYGLTAAIRARSGAEIALGADERCLVETVIERDRYDRSIEHRRQWLGCHGAAAVAAAAEPLQQKESERRESQTWTLPDRWFASGDEIHLHQRSLRIHATPGHTRGHIVYHDESHHLLFCGDHVLPHITPSLGYEPFPDGRALEQFLASLAAVRGLSADLVLPGHGQVFTDLAGRVDALVAHHRARLGTCEEILAHGQPWSAEAVADRLPWTRRGRTFSELDAFNRMLAVSETVTHLELLVRRGRLHRARSETGLAYLRAA